MEETAAGIGLGGAGRARRRAGRAVIPWAATPAPLKAAKTWSHAVRTAPLARSAPALNGRERSVRPADHGAARRPRSISFGGGGGNFGASIIRDAIRDFHGAIAMPVMAPIVVDRPSRSDAAERYEARTGARLRGFERDVSDVVSAWLQLSRTLRAAARRPADESDVSDLTDVVHHLERMAERMAIDDGRTEKDMLREARIQESRDGDLAAAHRRASRTSTSVRTKAGPASSSSIPGEATGSS